VTGQKKSTRKQKGNAENNRKQSKAPNPGPRSSQEGKMKPESVATIDWQL
jgi:hypothetical protein